MTKKEFIKACKKEAKRVGGIIAPSIMFDLFDDEDDIPEEWKIMFVTPPSKSRPVEVLCGPVRIKQMEEAKEEFIKSMKK